MCDFSYTHTHTHSYYFRLMKKIFMQVFMYPKYLLRKNLLTFLTHFATWWHLADCFAGNIGLVTKNLNCRMVFFDQLS